MKRDEAKVREKYPKAYAFECGDALARPSTYGFYILIPMGRGKYHTTISRKMKTENLAWKSAAEEITSLNTQG